MLLSIVMTLVISVNGFVKFFIQSVEPVEDEIFVYGLLLSLLVLSILYYAYRYFKPVKEFKYIVLNNLQTDCTLRIEWRVLYISSFSIR